MGDACRVFLFCSGGRSRHRRHRACRVSDLACRFWHVAFKRCGCVRMYRHACRVCHILVDASRLYRRVLPFAGRVYGTQRHIGDGHRLFDRSLYAHNLLPRRDPEIHVLYPGQLYGGTLPQLHDARRAGENFRESFARLCRDAERGIFAHVRLLRRGGRNSRHVCCTCVRGGTVRGTQCPDGGPSPQEKG